MDREVHGPAAAGPYLKELLSQPPYRQLWERHSARSAAKLTMSAVAAVIADHLWETGERADASSRDLKDRVGRALRGQVLSATTLRWFIGAFDLGPIEEQTLWSMLREPEQGNLVIRGTSESPIKTPARHRTLSLHEFHTVGADRLPERHRTIHVIEALVDSFDRHPYRFDTATARVEVVQGGQASDPIPVEAGLHAVDIVLTRPLNRGQTASFEYETFFSYREPPAPVFRRGAFSQVQNLDIRVRFAPRAVPKRIVWCVWPDLEADPVIQEEVELDRELVVHRFCRSVSGAVVGFEWAW